ncbi:MAG TPA: hypothetical protein VFV93_02875 [Thermomicrobiales bacterium]|nr:hypothetical protein [Thermomicrobiales bacterium]
MEISAISKWGGMDRLVEQQHSDAGKSILLLVPDVFFAVNVRNAVRRVGYDPHVLKTTDDLIVAAGEEQPALAVVDLAAVDGDAEWADIGDLARAGLPVLVFGSHKDVDGLRAAKSAGVTRVVSNGQFHREMDDLIQRYALASSCAIADEDLDIDEPLGSLPPGMAEHLPDSEPVRSAIDE